MDSRRRTTTALLSCVALCASALACAYGVIASFEPSPNALVFRVAYAAGVFACIWGVLRVVRTRLK
jgi:Fe2+ transport system protein B